MTPAIGGGTELGPDEETAPLEELGAFLHDPSTLTDPYPLFHQVRARDPVHWNERLQSWVVLSWDGAMSAFRDPNLSREEASRRQFQPLADGASEQVAVAVRMFTSSLLMREGPDHTRLRRLISKAFTPRAVANWRPVVEQAADQLLDGLQQQPRFDFIGEYAYPLPEMVICTLLGVPYQDHQLFTEWNAALSHSSVYTPEGVGSATFEAARRRTQDALMGYRDYFEDLIKTRQATARTGDLLSLLLDAREEEDRLSHEELIGTLMILILAGHHTTANLLGNGMLALLRHPEQLRILRATPELAPAAVEELLRYDTSARGQNRVATGPTEIQGKSVAPGDTVVVVLNAVNRDPARFLEPDRLDLTRPEPENLSFAAGAHYCIGASLARLEGQVGILKAVQRLGSYRLATTDIRYKPSFGRSAAAIPLEREPGPGPG
jgi:cytochrome P450